MKKGEQNKTCIEFFFKGVNLINSNTQKIKWKSMGFDKHSHIFSSDAISKEYIV